MTYVRSIYVDGMLGNNYDYLFLDRKRYKISIQLHSSCTLLGYYEMVSVTEIINQNELSKW